MVIFLKDVRGKSNEFDPFRLVKLIVRPFVVALAAVTILFFILSPSYIPKTTERVVEVQNSLPNDFSGLYFVQIADGEKAKGVSARIIKEEYNNYILQVYGNSPMRRYSLQLDKEKGFFMCDVLGKGYIIYDKQTNSTTINFSNIWVFIN